MHLDVVTPVKKLFSEDNIDEIVVTTSAGEIAILPHHANLLTKLAPGEMTIKHKGKEEYLAVTGGFLEVTNDQITILADYAVRSEDIEVEKVMQAQKRAEEVIKKKTEGISERDLTVAQSDIIRAVLELKVANRRRHRQTRQT